MSLNTTPRTWVTGEVVTAAEMNTEVRDALIGIQAAWTAYTPTLTNITLGNGSLSFAFTRFGKYVALRGQFLAGSTTTYGGVFAMTLPVTPIAAITSTGGYAIGSAVLQPGAAATRVGSTVVVTTTATINFMVDNGAANTLAATATPAAWGTSGMISLAALYEAA